MDFNQALNHLAGTQNGAGTLKAMIGATFQGVSDTTVYIRFRGSRRYNWAALELLPTDLYRLTLGRISGMAPAMSRRLYRTCRAPIRANRLLTW